MPVKSEIDAMRSAMEEILGIISPLKISPIPLLGASDDCRETGYYH
jgi:hypothetical protein